MTTSSPVPRYLNLAALTLAFCLTSIGGIAQKERKPLPPGPMLDGGHVVLTGTALRLDLLRFSGTVAQLSPLLAPAIDYTPGERLKERSADTFYHLGDLDLRLRTEGEATWTDYSTAFRRKPVRVLAEDATHFSADLAPTLAESIPLQVVRTWTVAGDELRLDFVLSNRSAKPVQLGGFGIPMVFNNNMNGLTLDQSYEKCSFYDPSIAQDAGYVQVVRLTGTGPVLVLAPDGHTPLEAWKPILDKRTPDGAGTLLNDPTPRGMTYEGSFDWMVHSGAFAETEWKGAEQWNPATEATLAPGQTIHYGLRFFVAPSVREVEATLTQHGRPVAVGIPGYILPQDTAGRLFLKAASPVQSIASEPADAISIQDDGSAPDRSWHAYTLVGKRWGRARLLVTYADGTRQSIPYRTIKSAKEAVADMGRFLFHQQWFEDPADPFHRSPSVISWDNEAGKQLRQESRVWIAGLSDEGGAGSWLAAAMKESLQPEPEEVAKLERFVNETVWGHLQVAEGKQKYGVQKSLFYYQPDQLPAGFYDPSINWKSWTSWNKTDAADVGRTYNYPHVVAAYWSLYRVARNSTGIATHKPWQWYLDQAFQTTMAMQPLAPYYTQFGLMEGTVFLRLLEDLKAEGWSEKASTLEGFMRKRAEHWKEEPYPFGSEMPWDSTGQEEVYDWTHYFGFEDKAKVTLDAILAYTPVVPSWGYNGSARRYWDFLYGGKYPRIERQLHHYGSGINAIPLLAEYRQHPTDLHLLRAGYGGVLGPLTNIDENGFASAAFHSFPDRMAFDPYTGDYGPNFLGHALNTGAYLIHDDRFGWLGFGGNVTVTGKHIQMAITDSSRRRVFVAPVALWATLDAGQFTSVDYDIGSGTIHLRLAPGTHNVHTARLRLLRTDPSAPSFVLKGGTPRTGIYEVPLHRGETSLTIARGSATPVSRYP